MKNSILKISILLIMIFGISCGDDSSTRGRDDLTEEENKPQAPACEDRSECTVTSECVDGHCAPHLVCYERNARVRLNSWWANRCSADWSECSDSREYTLECFDEQNGTVMPCACIVNGITVNTFNWVLDEYACTPREIHRVANELCGWLMPAMR